MKRMARSRRLGFACLALVVLLGLAAVADHRWKSAQMGRAELSEYYCSHDGTQCDRGSSEAIERHWNQRETGYVIAMAILATLGVALVVSGRAPRKGPRI